MKHRGYVRSTCGVGSVTDAIEKWKKQVASLPPLHELDVKRAEEWKKKKQKERRKKGLPKKLPRLPRGNKYLSPNKSKDFDCTLHGKKFHWKERCWGCDNLLRDI